MLEFLQTPWAKLIVLVAILMILSVIGFYIVERFRGGAEQTETSSDMLSKFGEMRQTGDLQDGEYRSIKTILAARMQAEIKRDNDTC